MKRNRHTGDSADNPFDYIRVSRILCIGCLFQHPFPQFIQTVITGNDDLTIFLVPGIDKRAFYSFLADIRASFHQIFFADFSQCLGNDGLDPIWFGNLLGDQIFNDSLTGVYNRRYYDEQASELLVQAAAMLDIDHVKEGNDIWRHMAGDAALRQVTQVVSSCTRRTDIFLRYGGDEFLLAFEDIPQDVFMRKLEDICAAVERTEVPGYPQIHLTLSIGGVYEKGQLKMCLRKPMRPFTRQNVSGGVSLSAYGGAKQAAK